HREVAAGRAGALRLDAPSLRLDRPARNRQPEAGSGLLGARRLVRLEDRAELLRRQTLAGVPDIDDDFATRVRHRDLYLAIVGVLDGVLREVLKRRPGQVDVHGEREVWIVGRPEAQAFLLRRAPDGLDRFHQVTERRFAGCDRDLAGFELLGQQHAVDQLAEPLETAIQDVERTLLLGRSGSA